MGPVFGCILRLTLFLDISEEKINEKLLKNLFENSESGCVYSVHQPLSPCNFFVQLKCYTETKAVFSVHGTNYSAA